MLLTPQTAGVLAAVAAVGLILLYRAALPKPIPGVPYKKESAQRIFGDLPDVMKSLGETGQVTKVFWSRCLEFKSPVAQVFMKPFGKPWVVVADDREAQDIMMRRTREFDRSDILGDAIVSLFPREQVSMKTNDQWRYNRKLVGPTMNTKFLNEVVAPKVQDCFQDIIDLWRQKARIAEGHVIDVASDSKYCMCDIMLSSTFGTELGAAKSQVKYLSTLDAMPATSAPATVTEIPVHGLPELFKCLYDLIQSLEIPVNSPFGRRHHWFAIKFYPKYRRATANKNRVCQSVLDQAWKTHSAQKSDRFKFDDEAKSMVDLIVMREFDAERRQGVEPGRDKIMKDTLYEELTAFVHAGVDTTGNVTNWGIKYITGYQDVQRRLREEVKAAFPRAAETGQQLSGKEIAEKDIPYLDAFVEESLRLGSTSPASFRVSTTDTVVLGHFIPKGTDIVLTTQGPSFSSPPIAVGEHKRSDSSRNSKDTSGRRYDNLDKFAPERWLVKNTDGKTSFDARAAPNQQFGNGQRGCFGKKMAYLELRIIFASIVWNFQLEPIPQSLTDDRVHEGLVYAPQNLRVILKPLR